MQDVEELIAAVLEKFPEAEDEIGRDKLLNRMRNWYSNTKRKIGRHVPEESDNEGN